MNESDPQAVPGPAPRPGAIRWLPEALLLVSITLMGAGVDQWTKGWAVERLGPLTKDARGRMRPPRDKPPLEVIDGWFRFNITGNQGAIFGLGRNLSEGFKRKFFIGTALVAMLFILLLMGHSRPEQRPRRIGLAAVLAGAVGNFIDRVRFDYVVDFCDWYAGFNWPTFNVADVWISVGVGLVLLDLWVHPDPPPPTAPAPADPPEADAAPDDGDVPEAEAPSTPPQESR